jgi:hypothetical protein
MIGAYRLIRLGVLLGGATMAAGAGAPAAAQSVTLSQIGAVVGPAELVRVQNGVAYVASGKTLTLLDITNPAAPKKTGAYAFPEKIWGFRIVGSTAYVAADFFGLGVLDVSNPAAPVLRGSFKTPGQAKNVGIFGTKVLVADHMSGVDYIDVSNAAKPTSLGSFFLDGYARDVIAVGAMAYAVDAPAGLYILDLAKEGPLDTVGTAQSASAPAFIEVADTPAGSPKLAYLVGGGMLQIYDVSDPAAPAKVSTLRIPGRPTRAAVKGTMAYVVSGAEGIQIVDLSTPATPKIVGSFKTPSPARDVAVSDSLVFAAVGAAEGTGQLLILKQTP